MSTMLSVNEMLKCLVAALKDIIGLDMGSLVF
jgi:hypothetical protein